MGGYLVAFVLLDSDNRLMDRFVFIKKKPCSWKTELFSSNKKDGTEVQFSAYETHLEN